MKSPFINLKKPENIMKRKLFYLFERLQIKRSERIAIIVLMVLTVMSALIHTHPALLMGQPDYDYSRSDSIFAERSALLHSEREEIMKRYNPVLAEHQTIRVVRPVNSVKDTIVPDSVKKSTISEYGTLVNINSASAEELQKLPGIGPAYASRIVNWRNQYGPFRSKDQLIEIKGIGEKRLERIRPLVTL